MNYLKWITRGKVQFENLDLVVSICEDEDGRVKIWYQSFDQDSPFDLDQEEGKAFLEALEVHYSMFNAHDTIQ